MQSSVTACPTAPTPISEEVEEPEIWDMERRGYSGAHALGRFRAKSVLLLYEQRER